MESLSENEQKRGSVGETSYKEGVAEAGDANEARFMSTKPGGSDTLPGWRRARGALNTYVLIIFDLI